jgi:hypothetical protein
LLQSPIWDSIVLYQVKVLKLFGISLGIMGSAVVTFIFAKQYKNKTIYHEPMKVVKMVQYFTRLDVIYTTVSLEIFL